MNNKITVSEDEYNKLLDSDAKLRALEEWGVDNWNGYDDALSSYRKAKEADEELDSLIDDIVNLCSENVDVDPAGPGTGVMLNPNTTEIKKLLLDWEATRKQNG